MRASGDDRRPPWRRLRWWLTAYLVVLLASHAWRAFGVPERQPDLTEPSVAALELPAFEGDQALKGRTQTLVYDTFGPADAPVVLGLHGSPGGRGNFRLLASKTPGYRWILPDLPGFGDSSRDLPDHSFLAQAATLRALMAELEIESAHVVGYSMGSATGLRLQELIGERVRSLTLLSGLGVVELELLGNQAMNHALHGLQAGALWLIEEGVPHFGKFDDGWFGLDYARSFYDSDQEPLRGLLADYRGPLLIVHGRDDPLVPFAAAEEHARIVPQARQLILPGGHGIVWSRAGDIGAELVRFLDDVDAGRAERRAEAEPARLAAAQREFDPGEFPLDGALLVAVLILIALATFASEDLTCIGTGALVSQGRLPFWAGTFACFMGILVGDMLLYGLGRLFGARATKLPPLSWMLSEARMQRAANWFEKRGLIAIFLTRFTPGMRLPTYVAAGAMRARFLSFALYFAIAAAVWTPILVWVSSQIGGTLTEKVEAFKNSLPLALAVTVALGVLVVHFGVPLLTWRGRKLLVGGWRAKLHWEFWPVWVVYGALFPYLLWLSVRHRSLTVFCAANPGMPAGGVVGESKSAILAALESAGEANPPFCALPAAENSDRRLAEFDAFVERTGGYPVVLKPDAGQRGSGVLIARDRAAAAEYLSETRIDLVAQAFLPGHEYGVFYARRAAEPVGRVISITDKRLAVVTGDGKATLEQLILEDSRAVQMAHYYLDRNAERLEDVVPAGFEVELGELGTHARGAIFLDGGGLHSEALVAEVDRIAQSFEGGFQFGRFDLRAPDAAALTAGRDLRVIELNGVTSESTHVYDPQYSFATGLRTLAAQWRECFEIGAENVAAGKAEAPGVFGLLRAWWSYRREQGQHRGG